jgi:hypothetical protein
MRVRGLFAVLGIIISITVVSLIHTPPVSGVGEPDIEITLATKSVTAFVAPGQEGLVSFTGDVSTDAPWSPNIQYFIVELTAEAGGWGVSTPSPLIFSKETVVQPFRITVQVPSETSSSVMAELIVGGTWNYDPGVMSGDVEPARGIIYIQQYYSIGLSCDDSIIECPRAKTSDMDILVRNDGNGPDKIHPEVENADDLREDDISARFPTDVTDVPEKQERPLSLLLTKGSNTMRGEYSATVEGYSVNAARLGQSYDVEILEIVIEVAREDRGDSGEDGPEDVENNITDQPDSDEEEEGESVNPDNMDRETDPIQDEKNDENKTSCVSPFLLIVVCILTGCIMRNRRSNRYT